MRVLVTGGAGFIGSHLASRLLELGHQVTVVDNESTGRREHVPAGARYVRGDVTVAAELEPAFAGGLDAVLHVAGQASTIRSFDDPGADLHTNVGGTLGVLRACLAHRVPRLLYASSMTVYGHPRALPVDEEHPLAPASYYGVAKLAAERYVHATGARGDLDFSFAVTSFRMFNVYGERQSLENPYQGVLAIFLGAVLRGEPITIYGDGEQSRDFVYVGDVAEAWVAALERPAARGEVMNLGTGTRRSLHELIAALAAAAGARPELRFAAERPGDQRHMQAAVGKAERLLGWRPRVSLEEGMARTLAWARQALGGAR